MSQSSPDELPTSLDVDLPCLNCGYNLRGLAGDPVTCPECGMVNPLGEGEIPEDMVARQMRRMETPLAGCALATAFGLPSAGLFLLTLMEIPPGAPTLDYLACCGLPTMVTPAGFWLWGVAEFKSYCQHRPGWWRAFWTYQLWALASIAVVGGPTFTALCVVGFYNYHAPVAEELISFCIVMVLLFLVNLVAIVNWRSRLHTWLRTRIGPLQRDAAIELVREGIRRRMSDRKPGS